MARPVLTEEIIAPEIPIVDAHHHLLFFTEESLKAQERITSAYVRMMLPIFRRNARYLLEEYLADINTGHNVRATVYIEAHTMYRAKEPPAMKSVGEIEFANGIAAMAASGLYGDVAVCAGIVGNVDFRIGDAVEEVLLAQMRAGGSRFRGIRASLRDTDILDTGRSRTASVMADETFRAGFKHLERLGLSFEGWVFEPQMPDLIDLARAFPETRIIVNHTGGPVGTGHYAGKLEERFPVWRENIRTLSQCPNIFMKLGGLGLPSTGFRTTCAATSPNSANLAADWRPYIETCIEAFGAERCMFESNFPVDACTASYAVTWNAFKRVTAGASATETAALFSGTATRAYNLAL